MTSQKEDNNINDQNATKMQNLENLVVELRRQNAQTTRQLHDERIKWESQSIDYERQIAMLQGQATKYVETATELSKTKDELEAAQSELQHLSKLYSEFMSWQQTKSTLTGERDKLLLQTQRQRVTIELLEKNMSSDTKAKIKTELEQDSRRSGLLPDHEDINNKSNNEQTTLVNRVIEEQKQQNRSWLSLGMFLGGGSSSTELSSVNENIDHTMGGEDLNALKRLDDRMKRAKKISSSASSSPSKSLQINKLPSYDDDDDDHNGILSSNIEGIHQQHQYDEFSSEREFHAPRVSEDPNNIHNIINLI